MILSNASFTPAYDRKAVRAGVVHLGLGAFHRAHQAPVFDALLSAGDLRWGVTGVAMRSPGVVERLRAQDGIYGLSIRAAQTPPPRVIASIVALHVAALEREAVVGAIAAPDTHLVTLTVTEKGYLVDPANAADTPAGLIAEGLERRRLGGLAPLTILSCDNRTGNGSFGQQAVLTAARAAHISDAGLRWIAEQAAFPSTMVDRITPATTAAMTEETSVGLGLTDEAAVWTEPFWQWVIEDRFAAARPDFAAHGVEMVTDVAPWEDCKLRLLNASHSALAYLGLLRGHQFVHQAIADPELRRYVEAIWDEGQVTLDANVVDIPAYRTALVERFSNPALPHALIQIAGDGSQKLPPRILATMTERAGRGLDSPALAGAVAAWIEVLATVDGLADPLLADLQRLARANAPATELLGAIGVSPEQGQAIAEQVDHAKESS